MYNIIGKECEAAIYHYDVTCNAKYMYLCGKCYQMSNIMYMCADNKLYNYTVEPL